MAVKRKASKAKANAQEVEALKDNVLPDLETKVKVETEAKADALSHSLPGAIAVETALERVPASTPAISMLL